MKIPFLKAYLQRNHKYKKNSKCNLYILLKLNNLDPNHIFYNSFNIFISKIPIITIHRRPKATE